MRVAIDKTCIQQIKDLQEYEYIYIFDDEDYQDLLKLNIHCIHKNYIQAVDINLSSYKINCLKKTKVQDKEWYKLPKIEENKYAIIVPNYNNDHGNYKGKTYLQNCIESILNQSYKEFYLVIVDDMSTDSSVTTIKSYDDERIHLIQNSRKRYNGGSRNAGIEYALDNLNFNYFCFLDSDDWWLHKDVLLHINKKIFNNEMMTLGSQMLFEGGTTCEQLNEFDTYEDIFFCINKIWCTAWSRVIRRDKIAYFCEDTLMEDRVWSYKQADNVDFENCVCLGEVVYCWNRLNVSNSVSIQRNAIWNASAWCHIGHQLQFLENLKHKEMAEQLENRIQACISKANSGIYQQY